MLLILKLRKYKITCEDHAYITHDDDPLVAWNISQVVWIITDKSKANENENVYVR